jgi:hypothetical protein
LQGFLVIIEQIGLMTKANDSSNLIKGCITFLFKSFAVDEGHILYDLTLNSNVICAYVPRHSEELVLKRVLYEFF